MSSMVWMAWLMAHRLERFLLVTVLAFHRMANELTLALQRIGQ